MHEWQPEFTNLGFNNDINLRVLLGRGCNNSNNFWGADNSKLALFSELRTWSHIHNEYYIRNAVSKYGWKKNLRVPQFKFQLSSITRGSELLWDHLKNSSKWVDLRTVKKNGTFNFQQTRICAWISDLFVNFTANQCFFVSNCSYCTFHYRNIWLKLPCFQAAGIFWTDSFFALQSILYQSMKKHRYFPSIHV